MTRLARNVGSSYGLRALRGLSVLLLTPYLFRQLGTDGFGTWSLLFTVATIFNLIELGATTGITKYVAECHGDDRADDVRDLVGVGSALMLVAGVVSLALSGLLAVAASSLAAPGQAGAFTAGLLLIGAAQIVRLPGQAYGATLMGLQRYELYNAGEALTVLGFAVGAVLAIQLGGGIAWLGAAYGGSLAVGAITWVVLLRRVAPDAFAGPRSGSATVRRRAAGFGWRTLLIDSMDFIAQRMDTLVAAAIKGAAATAPLAAATRLISGVQSLVLPFATVLLPMVSELDATGRREALRRQFVVATRVALQVTLLTAGGLALFAGDVVRVWLGPSAPGNTDEIVVVLMIVQILILTPLPAAKVLVGVGRLRAVTVLAILEGVLNLSLSVALVFAWGVIGAAIATLVTSGILVPIRIPLACRATGCGLGRLGRQALGAGVAACAPALAIMLAARLLLEPGAVRLFVGLGLGWTVGAGTAIAHLGPARLLALARRSEPGPTVVEPSA